MPQPFDHEIHVREHPLPGMARLLQMTLGDGSIVSVHAAARSTDRRLAIVPPGGDEPAANVHLSGAEAATLGALLSGIRFVVQASPDEQAVDAANLRTITLHAGSPAVGRRVHDLQLPDPDNAMIIAAIRDDTPELIETDADRVCAPGDRLVVVGRPGSMSALVHFLTG